VAWEQVYAAVTDLRDRGLVQARAQWRAVLPPAIANRLAARALKRVHPAILTNRLIDPAPIRLLKSFARRLGYLHDSAAEAQALVRAWLSSGGLLNDVASLDTERRAIFVNVAPVLPELTLRCLEVGFEDADEQTLRSCRDFIPVLQSLAYDDAYFARAVVLLIRCQAKDDDFAGQQRRATLVEPLFYITLSGTHAALSTRLEVIRHQLAAPDLASKRLGGQSLAAALKSDYFSGGTQFDFGARSRDYGHHPSVRSSGRGVVLQRARVRAGSCANAASARAIAPSTTSSTCRRPRPRARWCASRTSAGRSSSSIRS
jgi:hypothetical protein